MSTPSPLLAILQELTDTCYEVADAISGQHPAEDLHGDDTEDTPAPWAELPSRHGRRALELVDHEH